MFHRVGRFVPIVLALTLTSGCAQHLCSLQTSPAQPLPLHAPKEVNTAQWMMLLLRGPSHTCTGKPIVPSESASFGMRPLASPKHVLAIDGAGAHKHLLWLQTHEVGNTAFGPIAVVAQTSKGFVVETLGTLQGLVGEVRLQMAAKPAQQALWAIHKQCVFHPELLRHLCHEQLQVLPRVGDTFISSVEAPRIDLQRQEARALPGGWYRIVEQEVQCDVEAMALVLQESITAKDISALTPGLTPRHRRTATNRRTLSYDFQKGWAQSESALWTKFVP